MSTPPEAPHECPRCGAPYVEGQEYCLECGYHLGGGRSVVSVLSQWWQARFPWYPGDWIWPVLLGLLIAVLGGLAAALISPSGKSSNRTIVATQSSTVAEPATPPETATVALPTVPAGTPTAPPTTPSTPPPATTSTAAPGGLTPWPASRNGYTVVLESIPSRAGRSFAVSRARSASRAGLSQVGVLDSSRFSSLHPGYYVVFSGIYASKAAADAAASAAGGKGFASAYSRQISH
ncbi:MAG: hypothetical protein ACJ747_04600 [Gaiellaceae bacterium]